MKTYLRFFVASLFVSVVIALPVHAQMAVTGSRSQVHSLSTLPEADAIVYFNTSRIINDAMPRLLPQKELKEMRDGMEQLNILTGINLKNLELFVIAMRFNKPTSETEFPVPDAMLVARGDFDAKSLVGRAIKLSGAEVKEEKMGEHTLFTMSLLGKSKSQSTSSLEAAFSEIAVTNLDASTIAIGNTKYIKAALEAADGHGRIKSETLASVLRDPNALISITGSPVMAFAKSFGLKMVDNPDPNCMTRFGEYYLAFSMGVSDFSIHGAMNADNPNTARMVKNLLSGLIQEGKELVPDKNAQSIFDQARLSAEGDEVKAEVIIPQEMADKFIREMLAPKPPPKATATGAKTATKPRSRSGRSRRRT